MWKYEKKLQYPVNIKNPNPKYAQIIISQYGGPDGEMGASMRYLTQRYSMPYNEVKGMLTDIGKEEKYCAYKIDMRKLLSHIFFACVFPSRARRCLALFTPFRS